MDDLLLRCSKGAVKKSFKAKGSVAKSSKMDDFAIFPFVLFNFYFKQMDSSIGLNGSPGIEYLFHSGCFHRTPDAFSLYGWYTCQLLCHISCFRAS